MITIDGSAGEGGGQVVRTALALSLTTGTPFRIDQIRAKRSRPGLLRQHLTAVQAAAAVGRAHVDGAAIGSRTLTFVPSGVESGDYTFSIGTAGSATLVLQAVLPALVAGAAGRTSLVLEGGTHNPWAPPFDFLDRVFLPIVNRLGPRVEARLERHGFYPAGGGRFAVTIDPSPIGRLDLLERGEIRERRARVLIAHLAPHIAARELATVGRLLNWKEEWATIEVVPGSIGPGNALLVEIVSDHASEICTAFGESGTPAEAVADRAADEARRYLAAGVPVGAHLADQLLPILAVGAGGRFRTVKPTQHTLTNIEVLRLFGYGDVTVTPEGHDVVRIDVGASA